MDNGSAPAITAFLKISFTVIALLQSCCAYSQLFNIIARYTVKCKWRIVYSDAFLRVTILHDRKGLRSWSRRLYSRALMFDVRFNRKLLDGDWNFGYHRLEKKKWTADAAVQGCIAEDLKRQAVNQYHRNEMKTDTVGVIPAVSVFTYLFSGCYSWAWYFWSGS